MVTDSIHLILGKFNTTLDHLVEAREMLEMAIVRMASTRITHEQLMLLDQYIERMEKVLGSAEEYVFYDMKFHVTLAESAQNPVYLLFLNSILELIQKKSISMALYSPHSMKRAQEHHRAIYLALAEGNEAKAVKALQGHVTQIREDAAVLKDLDFS